MGEKLRDLAVVIAARWAASVLVVGAVILFISAAAKTITYGLSPTWSYHMRAVEGISRSLLFVTVVVECGTAVAVLSKRIPLRIRYYLLFSLCMLFIGFRVFNTDGQPCGCFVNPAILTSAAARMFDQLALACLVFMTGGSTLAILQGQNATGTGPSVGPAKADPA